MTKLFKQLIILMLLVVVSSVFVSCKPKENYKELYFAQILGYPTSDYKSIEGFIKEDSELYCVAEYVDVENDRFNIKSLSIISKDKKKKIYAKMETDKIFHKVNDLSYVTSVIHMALDMIQSGMYDGDDSRLINSLKDFENQFSE